MRRKLVIVACVLLLLSSLKCIASNFKVDVKAADCYSLHNLALAVDKTITLIDQNDTTTVALLDILTVTDWVNIVSTAILVVSIIIAYYFSSKTLKELKTQMRMSVYSEYTRRYSEIIRDLPGAASDSQLSVLNKVSKREKDGIMGLLRAYFDLCSEEHYLFETGRIDCKTWSRWERGLTYTIRLPTFVDAWKLIKVEGYDEAFVKYIDKIISTKKPINT